VLAGGLLLLSGLLGLGVLPVLIASAFVVIVPITYSYFAYRRLEHG
jgi:hypothetical protein